MEYQSFKSQALDFNVYSDGIDVVDVTPQYALTREYIAKDETEQSAIQYYSTTSTTTAIWLPLIKITDLNNKPTAEDIAAALGLIKEDENEDQDTWWVGDSFETLLAEY